MAMCTLKWFVFLLSHGLECWHVHQTTITLPNNVHTKSIYSIAIYNISRSSKSETNRSYEWMCSIWYKKLCINGTESDWFIRWISLLAAISSLEYATNGISFIIHMSVLQHIEWCYKTLLSDDADGSSMFDWYIRCHCITSLNNYRNHFGVSVIASIKCGNCYPIKWNYN